MKCPACGNYAKSGWSQFFGFNLVKFRCQYCNEMLRGNGLMYFLDFLTVAAIGGYIAALSTFSVLVADIFGDWSFPFLGFAGILFIRVFIMWLLTKAGRYHHAN